MTRDLSSLNTVAWIKEREEEAAAEQLAAAQRQLDDELTRLEMLQSYAEDYRHSVAGPSRPLRQLRDSQRFHLELHDTLLLQQTAVAAARQRVEAARAEWISARVARGAIGKLIARRVDERNRERLRIEQRSSDDQTLRRSMRSSADELH